MSRNDRPGSRWILAIALALFGCASPPPSAVDDEMLLVDIGACARGEPICARSGGVEATELLHSGQQALRMYAVLKCGEEYCNAVTQECCADSPNKCVARGACNGGPTVAPIPARISLPLQRPSDRARLTWITLGALAYGDPRRINVTLTGGAPITAQPILGFSRIEAAGYDAVPSPGARLELEVTHGTFELSWVVGRWKR